jgi:hypothetical protein
MTLARLEGDAMGPRRHSLHVRMGRIEKLMQRLNMGVPAPTDARTVLEFFKNDVLGYLEEEEEAVHPLVDRELRGLIPFTSVLRREHEVIRRWIAHLEVSAERPGLLRIFVRRAENLMGMLYLHVEAESVVRGLADCGEEPAFRRRRYTRRPGPGRGRVARPPRLIERPWGAVAGGRRRGQRR